MTAAGAERIVRLTAVSQTENAELEVFEIPIRVMAIEDVLINVEALPEPTLTFVSLELQDGTTFTNPQGSGTHPSGENLKFTWLLSNEAETVWNPSASLRLDAGLFGDCTPVEPVGKGDVSPVVCNLVIDQDMAPMSEPSFTVILNDGGIEETTNVGLLVATNEQVAWDLDAVPLFTTGQEREITVEITNVGNTPFQRQLVVGAPEAWSASIDGEDIVDLDVGQSSLMRISLRADSPGEASISLTLAQSPASEATYSFTVTSSGEPIGTSSESGLNSALTVGLLVLVLLVAFGFLGAQVIRNRNGPRPTSAAPAFHPVLPVPVAQSPAVPLAPQPASPVPAKAPAAPAAPAATAPPPMCWTCRQPVTTAMIGCPSCGARYHADGFNGCGAHEIETCVNCGAASSTFVDA